MFAAAFDSTIEDANYTIAADADRDGDVDAQDRAAVLSAFGFVANRAPVIDTTADPIVVRGTNPVTIATSAFVADGEGDATFVSVDTNDATASVLGGGLIRFVPANDTASLSLTADDGLLASDPVGLPIEYQSVDYVRLRISDRDPLLNRGQTKTLFVFGELADGTTELIPVDELTFQFG